MRASQWTLKSISPVLLADRSSNTDVLLEGNIGIVFNGYRSDVSMAVCRGMILAARYPRDSPSIPEFSTS